MFRYRWGRIPSSIVSGVGLLERYRARSLLLPRPFAALLRIRKDRLYRVTHKFKTFEEYCRERWG